jgi:hypothetical protein
VPYKDKNKQRLRDKRYYLKNKDIISARNKNYYLKNKKKIINREKQRYYYLKKHYPYLVILKSINARCNNVKHKAYKYYGKMGIRNFLTKQEIKELWFRDKAWLLKDPTIDRIDSNKNYVYDNCRFIERIANTNRRNNQPENLRRIIGQFTMCGEFVREWPSAREIERKLGIPHANIIKCCIGKQPYSHRFLWGYLQ